MVEHDESPTPAPEQRVEEYLFDASFAAEHSAFEVVAAARREIRRIVTAARQQLTALGEPGTGTADESVPTATAGWADDRTLGETSAFPPPSSGIRQALLLARAELDIIDAATERPLDSGPPDRVRTGAERGLRRAEAPATSPAVSSLASVSSERELLGLEIAEARSGPRPARPGGAPEEGAGNALPAERPLHAAAPARTSSALVEPSDRVTPEAVVAAPATPEPAPAEADSASTGLPAPETPTTGTPAPETHGAWAPAPPVAALVTSASLSRNDPPPAAERQEPDADPAPGRAPVVPAGRQRTGIFGDAEPERPDIRARGAWPGVARAFVASFLLAGVAIAGASYYWTTSAPSDTGGPGTPADATAVPSAPVAPSTTPSSLASLDDADITGPGEAAAAGLPADALGPDAISLRLEAIRDAWVRVTIDGDAENGRTLRAGEVREVPFARAIEVRAGDAGAVLVSLDGEPAVPLGRDGQVLTRRFGEVQTPPDATLQADQAEGAAARAGNLAPAPDAGTARPATSPPPRPSSATTEPAQAAPVGNGQAPPAGADVSSPSRASNAQSPAGVRPAPVSTAAAPAGAAPAARTPGAPVPAGRPDSPAASPAAPAADVPPAPPRDIVEAGSQWLRAYQAQARQDMAALQAPDLDLLDERSAGERPAPGLAGVTQSLSDVSLALAGDTAMLTADMVERAAAASDAEAYRSRVSQTWIRENGQWHLKSVRIVGQEASLP
ncbi:MAG: RodZ domain-containing protein [Vicinamibacterales bacterium]